MWKTDEHKQELDIFPVYTDHLTPDQRADIESFPQLNANDCKKINGCFTPYIFYKRTSAGRYTCFCTNCNKEYKVNLNDVDDIYHVQDEVRHGYRGVCPYCKVNAEYKSAGYKQVGLAEAIDLCVYKVVDDLVYIFAAVVEKNYNLYSTDDYDREPNIVVDIKKMYVLRKGRAEVYDVGYAYTRHGFTAFFRPIKKKICGAFNDGFASRPKRYLYKETLRNTFLKYSGIDFVKNGYITQFDQERYYTAYAMYPILEMATKMDCAMFVQDLLWRNKKNYKILDWSAKSPKKFFKHLTLNEVKAVLENHTPAEVIEVYQDFKRKGKKKDLFYCRMYSYIIDYCTSIEKAGVDPEQALEYLRKVMKHSPEEERCEDDHSEIRRLVKLYDDYANIGLKIGYDFRLKNIAFPRDLNEAHDNAVENFNFMEEECKRKEAAELEEAYKPRYKKLCKKYKGYSYPGIQLVVPKNAESIIKEGKDLQICVGGYASRHCNGATTILFIRKPSDLDKSWFTIEIGNDDRIVQCHGFKNEQAQDTLTGKKLEKPEIIKAFEVNFQEWLNSQKKQNKRKKAS